MLAQWQTNRNDRQVITGNPHLAVERAERRFGFELVRVDDDGVIDLQSFKREIAHPSVVAVYAQVRRSLSWYSLIACMRGLQMSRSGASRRMGSPRRMGSRS